MPLIDALTTTGRGDDARTITGDRDGVAFTAQRRWWGRTWRLMGTSPSPIPEAVVLYVSRIGMDHGFWRDLRVGDDAFDRAHFVFCDRPAILPMLVGDATRRALAASERHPIVLYQRGTTLRTEGTHPDADDGAVERHVAIRDALARDQEAFRVAWSELMALGLGRATDGWPPAGTILSRAGTLLARLSWTNPTTRDGADWDHAYTSLRTTLITVESRSGRQWRTFDPGPGIAGTHTFAGRGFIVHGTPTLSLPSIEQLVATGDVVDLQVGRHVHVSLRGRARATQLAAGVQLVERIVGATAHDSPYR